VQKRYIASQVKGANLQNCGTTLEYFTIKNIIASCLNTSESVVENFQELWPEQHFKLGKWCILAFLKYT